jgi:hypothetical protein
LLQDLNFGSSYGLKLSYIKSQSLNPASAGFLRLGYDQNVSWRNNANSGDLSLNLDSSDNLQFNSTKIPLSGAIVNSDINASAAITYSKLALSNSIVNNDINSSAAIAYSKLNIADADLSIAKTSGLQSALDAKLSLSSGSNNQTIRNNSGTLEWSSSLTIDSSGNAVLASAGNKSLSVYGSTASNTSTLDIGATATAGTATLNLTGGADYTGGLTLQRASGNNSNSFLDHKGTGILYMRTIQKGQIRMETNSVQALGIGSDGKVSIGNFTGASFRLDVKDNPGSNYVARVENFTNSGNMKTIISTFGSSGNSTNSEHFRGETSGVINYYIYGNGTTGTSSDVRLKTNVESAREGYLQDLCQLRVVKYNWVVGDESAPKELGLIAQEVEQVFPGLVTERSDAAEDGIHYKGIKTSVIPYMLLKAIQELNAKHEAESQAKDTQISSLQSDVSALIARIEALENLNS